MSKPLSGRRLYLFPRTATYPMLLERYLEREQRSRVVDAEQLTSEWKAWYDKVSAKQRQS